MRSIGALAVFLAVLWTVSAHPLLRLSLNTNAGNDFVCPDQTSCNEGDTCCETSPGSYGCCPVPNAVCCSNGINCCPQGTKCDLAKQVCVRNIDSADSNMVSITSSKRGRPSLKDIYCHGGYCDDTETCCLLGCCPKTHAMCCGTSIWCCPYGTTCDPPFCNYLVSSMVAVTPRKRSFAKLHNSSPSLKSVQCPDQQGECPNGNTCCLNSGQYGCCPLPDASCCADGVHCCPSGTKCDGDKCTPQRRYIDSYRVSAKKKPQFGSRNSRL